MTATPDRIMWLVRSQSRCQVINMKDRNTRTHLAEKDLCVCVSRLDVYGVNVIPVKRWTFHWISHGSDLTLTAPAFPLHNKIKRRNILRLKAEKQPADLASLSEISTVSHIYPDSKVWKLFLKANDRFKWTHSFIYCQQLTGSLNLRQFTKHCECL